MGGLGGDRAGQHGRSYRRGRKYRLDQCQHYPAHVGQLCAGMQPDSHRPVMGL